jgi:hypothetical protein
MEIKHFTSNRTRLAWTGAAAAAMATAMLSAAGCSSTSKVADTSATSSSSGPQASTDAGVGSTTAASSTSGSATASAAMTTWVKDVVDGQYQPACLQMAEVATATSAPRTGSVTTCADLTKPIGLAGSTVTEESILKQLHASFAPTKASGGTQVQVTGVNPTGSTATVSAKQISIDDQTLFTIMLSRSTGVTADQLNATFDVSEISGRWYVTDFNLQAG